MHREPIYTPRPDLVAQYPTRPDFRQFRVPNIGFTVQKAAVDKGIAKEFPIILSSGRLVEYEGGGEETRSNPWLAELQQDMFERSTRRTRPSAASVTAAGLGDRRREQFEGPHESARHRARRQGCRLDAVPLRWLVPGEDQRAKYPKGTDPYVLGESVNAVTTYGYDPVTGMQETKVTLCQIRAA